MFILLLFIKKYKLREFQVKIYATSWNLLYDIMNLNGEQIHLMIKVNINNIQSI